MLSNSGKKLTETAFLDNKVTDNHRDLPKLNVERRKLAGASKLIIFIRNEWKNFDWNELVNAIDKDLVDIKLPKLRQKIFDDLEDENPLNNYKI